MGQTDGKLLAQEWLFIMPTWWTTNVTWYGYVAFTWFWRKICHTFATQNRKNARGKIRTRDLFVRSETLYPAGLHAHVISIKFSIFNRHNFLFVATLNPAKLRAHILLICHVGNELCSGNLLFIATKNINRNINHFQVIIFLYGFIFLYDTNRFSSPACRRGQIFLFLS